MNFIYQKKQNWLDHFAPRDTKKHTSYTERLDRDTLQLTSYSKRYKIRVHVQWDYRLEWPSACGGFFLAGLTRNEWCARLHGAPIWKLRDTLKSTIHSCTKKYSPLFIIGLVSKKHPPNFCTKRAIHPKRSQKLYLTS